MSFVISNKQHLAPTEERMLYDPKVFVDEGIRIDKFDVAFGHPLYTSIIDMFLLRLEEENSEGKFFPIVPDGCIAMVFKGRLDNEVPTEGYLCGTIDEIKKIYIGPGDYYAFIRFIPGTGYSLIKNEKHAGSISDTAIPIRGSVSGEEQILSALERDIPRTERAGLISKIIRVHLQKEPDRYIIKYCTERIFTSQGNVKVEELAEETGFTARHIAKLFERCVGVSPKLYSQIIKLQASMDKIIDNEDKRLVEIALDSGFFDHAHMNRMYKKLIKTSSGEFKKNMLSKLDYSLIEDYISIDET